MENNERYDIFIYYSLYDTLFESYFDPPKDKVVDIWKINVSERNTFDILLTYVSMTLLFPLDIIHFVINDKTIDNLNEGWNIKNRIYNIKNKNMKLTEGGIKKDSVILCIIKSEDYYQDVCLKNTTNWDYIKRFPFKNYRIVKECKFME